MKGGLAGQQRSSPIMTWGILLNQIKKLASLGAWGMLLGLQNVTFEFGARVIVSDATWHIQPGDRIGLIGYNGTGKSTLLKVLVGQYAPSAGTVEKGRETTIGYLHQDLLSFDTNDSITGVALGAFERVQQLEKDIERLGRELEANPESEEVLHK